MDDFVGIFDIQFIGEIGPRRINITACIRNGDGHILYMLDEDNVKYNWSSMISMTTAERF